MTDKQYLIALTVFFFRRVFGSSFATNLELILLPTGLVMPYLRFALHSDQPILPLIVASGSIKCVLEAITPLHLAVAPHALVGRDDGVFSPLTIRQTRSSSISSRLSKGLFTTLAALSVRSNISICM